MIHEFDHVKIKGSGDTGIVWTSEMQTGYFFLWNGMLTTN